MRFAKLVGRLGLFILILSLGTMSALVQDEEEGLALANLSAASVQAIAIAPDGDALYTSLLGGPHPSGIYRSDDRGRTWRLVSSGPGVDINAMAVVKLASPEWKSTSDGILYVATDGGPAGSAGNLWRSYDSGQTWYKSILELPTDPHGMLPAISTLAVDPEQPGVLYVGTDGHGVYRIDTAWDGQGHELVNGLSLYGSHVHGMTVGPDSWVYALTGDGLFASDGNGWQKLSLPEAGASIAVSTTEPHSLYVGGVSTGVYRSTDRGQTWEQINNGMAMIPGVAMRVTALAIDEQEGADHVVAAIAYGAGSRLTGGGIYESRNGGYSWVRLADSDSLVTQLLIDRGDIYAVTANGLVRYGEPINLTPASILPGLRSLANPSGVQVLILVLTGALAGLALVGQVEWLSGRNRSKV